MQPPRHMSAIPPMLSFHLSSLATSCMSMNPWAYEIIFDAYNAFKQLTTLYTIRCLHIIHYCTHWECTHFNVFTHDTHLADVFNELLLVSSVLASRWSFQHFARNNSLRLEARQTASEYRLTWKSPKSITLLIIPSVYSSYYFGSKCFLTDQLVSGGFRNRVRKWPSTFPFLSVRLRPWFCREAVFHRCLCTWGCRLWFPSRMNRARPCSIHSWSTVKVIAYRVV